MITVRRRVFCRGCGAEIERQGGNGHWSATGGEGEPLRCPERGAPEMSERGVYVGGHAPRVLAEIHRPVPPAHWPARMKDVS